MNPNTSSRFARLLFALILIASSTIGAQPLQLERLERKTILLFTPHPDDDTFCCAGTLALLAKRQNNIHIVLYTNDDKGSADPDMTSERLARIRKAEEEEACRIIGIPKQNIASSLLGMGCKGLARMQWVSLC